MTQPRAGRTVDLAVVGAGIAGIAAAREAIARGLDVVVLEAMARPGGRAYTDGTRLGFPFDHGCQWLHAARLNPLRHYALSLGFACRRTRRLRRLMLDGRWQNAAEMRAWRRYDRRMAATVAALGRAGVDVPLSTVIDRPSRWEPVYEAWTAVITSVPPEEVSTLDLAHYHDTGDNWHVRDGLGSLIRRLAEGLPISLGTPVTAIDWRGPGVRLETGRGTVSARAAVVTASTTVLARGVPSFTPALPVEKQAAIDGLPLGAANRIALALDPAFARGLDPNSSIQVVPVGGFAINFQIRPFGWPAVIGYVGGGASRTLERAGEAALIAFATERLAEALGGQGRRAVRAAFATGWESAEWIGGGYSVARPGCGHLRPALAAPLAGRVFFAGEATSPAYYSTAHGAWMTGTEAARQAAGSLTDARPG